MPFPPLGALLDPGIEPPFLNVSCTGRQAVNLLFSAQPWPGRLGSRNQGQSRAENQSGLGRVCLGIQTTPRAPGTLSLPGFLCQATCFSQTPHLAPSSRLAACSPWSRECLNPHLPWFCLPSYSLPWKNHGFLTPSSDSILYLHQITCLTL